MPELRVKKVKQKMARRPRFVVILATILCPLLLTLVTEMIAWGSIKRGFVWMVESPEYFLVTLVFIALLYWLLMFVTKRPFVAFFMLFLPLSLLAGLSYVKMSLREIPILPWNRFLINELFKDTTLLGNLIVIGAAAILLFLVAIVFSIYLFGGIRVHVKPLLRCAALMLCFILLFPSGLALSTPLPEEDYGIVELYEDRGLVSGLASQFDRPPMEQPENWSKERVEEIYRDIPNLSASSDKRPDIILVMGEAFWDPTWLSNVNYSSDPLPNLHRLQKEAMHGRLLVEAYGGNTTNTEFSALTSVCTSLLAPELTCYTDLQPLKAPPALPSFLKSLGYRCDAIHPGTRSYLSRDQMFQQMGFDHFYTSESFPNPTYVGKYISDRDTADKIISLYEEHKGQKGDQPYFSMTTTIQNHYDFSLKAYGKNYPIGVEPPAGMGKRDVNMLTGYVQGAHATDALLGRLTDYFRQQDREVILIFWGDHLPSIAINFGVYQKGGLISSNHYADAEAFLQQAEKLHTTPFLIWDNRGEQKGDLGTLSPCYLLPVAMSRYQLPMSDYQYVLSTLYRKAPHFGLSSYGNYGNAADEESEEIVRFLQYDLLY